MRRRTGGRLEGACLIDGGGGQKEITCLVHDFSRLNHAEKARARGQIGEKRRVKLG